MAQGTGGNGARGQCFFRHRTAGPTTSLHRESTAGEVQDPVAKKPDGYILEDFADSARKMVEAARTRWSATLASTDANSGPHKRFIEQATRHQRPRRIPGR